MQRRGETGSVEDIVAQHQAHAVVAYEVAANYESLRQAVGRRLFGILQAATDVLAVAEQPPEPGEVLRRRDNEDVADAGQHQRRQRIVDHRLVVNGEQLLADTLGDGVEPCAAPARQYDTFHVKEAVREKSRPRNAPPKTLQK